MLQAVPLPPQSILPHSPENKSTPRVNAQCRAFAKWLGGKALRFANTEKKICCECQRGELRAKGKIKIIYARRKIIRKAPAFTKYLFLFFSILFWRLYYNTHRNTVPVPLPSATPTWWKINWSTAESKQAKHWPGFWALCFREVSGTPAFPFQSVLIAKETTQ